MRQKTGGPLGLSLLRADGTFSRLLVRYSPLLIIAIAWELALPAYAIAGARSTAA